MKRMFAALALGALVLGAAACSSTPSTTTTASTTAAAAAATSAPPTTAATKGSTPSKSPTVTKPTKVEKIDRSKLPTKAQNSPKNLNLTSDESDCIDFVIFKTYEDDPSMGTDDATLSGVAGGAIAACVDQDKIAEGITTAISTGGTSLTDTQLTCIKNEIAATDKESLAIFLGVLITEDATLMKPFQEALSNACNITAS